MCKGNENANCIWVRDADSKLHLGARCRQQIAFGCEVQTANCIWARGADSKLHFALFSSIPKGFGQGFRSSWGTFSHRSGLSAGFQVGGGQTDPFLWIVGSWGVSFCRHGTRCAGEVAAAVNNSYCIVGIAYNARIGGEAVTCPLPSLQRHPGHPGRAEGLSGGWWVLLSQILPAKRLLLGASAAGSPGVLGWMMGDTGCRGARLHVFRGGNLLGLHPRCENARGARMWWFHPKSLGSREGVWPFWGGCLCYGWRHQFSFRAKNCSFVRLI